MAHNQAELSEDEAPEIGTDAAVPYASKQRTSRRRWHHGWPNWTPGVH